MPISEGTQLHWASVLPPVPCFCRHAAVKSGYSSSLKASSMHLPAPCSSHRAQFISTSGFRGGMGSRMAHCCHLKQLLELRYLSCSATCCPRLLGFRTTSRIWTAVTSVIAAPTLFLLHHRTELYRDARGPKVCRGVSSPIRPLFPPSEQHHLQCQLWTITDIRAVLRGQHLPLVHIQERTNSSSNPCPSIVANF